jgi:hypothetical protein
MIASSRSSISWLTSRCSSVASARRSSAELVIAGPNVCMNVVIALPASVRANTSS